MAALYASPPSPICSFSQTSSILGDCDVHSRQCSAVPKPIIGGLSCLFAKHSTCLANDGVDTSSLSSSFTHGMSRRSSFNDLGSLRHGDTRCEDLASSYSSSYTPVTSSLKLREQSSPVSVFQGPLSSASTPIRSPHYGRMSRDSYSFNKWEGFKVSHRDGCFSHFVPGAVGLSCLDYELTADATEDLQTAPIESLVDYSSLNLDEELTFNFEGNEVHSKHDQERFNGATEPCHLDPYVGDILKNAQSRHEIFKDDFVIKAFYEAEKAHKGQVRISGDPYLTHCVETAVLLASIGSNKVVVAAGLLHDTLDDTRTDSEQLSSLFGKGVAHLVEGVSRLSQLSKLARDNNTASKTEEADRLHTMYLAMVDVRVVLIKLADRLHNMMTLGALPFEKQQRIAKETLEIFVPLANRIGVSSWKSQLENFCFKHLYPREYHELSSKLAERFREATIMAAIEKFDQALRKENITYYVLSGRSKSLYSTHKKMLKKKLSIDEIHDLRGLRLIVHNEENCYAALHIVHSLWPTVRGKQKDYINRPKLNGYKSLHTVVCGEDMLPLEVQIRTKEMHQQAEFGLAAHWRYKEGESKHSSFILQRVEWARWVLTFASETMDMKLRFAREDTEFRPPCPFPSHRDDCPHLDKLSGPQCAMDDPIFVIMMEEDKMTVQELPPNSTVKDMLEKMGNDNLPFISYGVPIKEELRPRLNHATVNDLNQKLKMGDLVELTPSIPVKSLPEYREEIRRMFDKTDDCKDESSEILVRNSEIKTIPSYV
uniref:GTP diphosphokinase n=1 Tax=Araucaria cunninghamii TaxID=56994 RepID=A0A0D6QY13_ARACU